MCRGRPLTRVAAIDCGTNSIRLLVADIADGRLTDVVRRLEIVRLGQGVDRTGRLAPEALERTRVALRSYAADIARSGAERVRLVATSATRDAANREEFAADVQTTLGVAPAVATGAEEAALSFAGATRVLGGGFRAPYLVVDIGGGSTEFVLGEHAVECALSVDIGCVRLAERHLSRDPPTPESVAAAAVDIDAALAAVAEAVDLGRARTLVGLAGSVTTVAAIALELPAYDAARIQHARIPVAAVREVTERLLTMTHDQRATLPVMHPGRVDVIAAGALVLRTVMDRLDWPDVVVSESDILDGIAWSLA